MAIPTVKIAFKKLGMEYVSLRRIHSQTEQTPKANMGGTLIKYKNSTFINSR